MSLAIAVALVCAALMGFAVTRGATCMVAAVDQLMRERRLSRLVAMRLMVDRYDAPMV